MVALKYPEEYRFVYNEEYNPEQIRNVQSELTSMGILVTSILKKNGIDYFLAFGTLLGAVRLGGYFPWDDDFDIFLFDDSYEEAIRVLNKELPKHLFIHDINNDPLYFKAWSTVKNKRTRVVTNHIYNIDNYLLDYPNIHIDLYRLKRIHHSEIDNYKKSEAKKFLQRKFAANLIDKNKYNFELQVLEKANNFKEHKNANIECAVYMFMLKLKKPLFFDDIFPLRTLDFDEATFRVPNNVDNVLKSSYEDYNSLPPLEKRISHYKKVVFINQNNS